MAIYQITEIDSESAWADVPELIGAIIQSVPRVSHIHYWHNDPTCGIEDFHVLNSRCNKRFRIYEDEATISIYGVTIKRLFK